MIEIRMKSPDDLPAAAEEFVRSMGNHRVFLFRAPMGAGKTTFIAEVCRCLGTGDAANSPSFAIVNEYRSGADEPIYHFDFYRIDSPREALDLGAEEYFYSGALCFVEWPERIESILPDDAVEVEIEVLPEGERVIKAYL